MTPPAVIGVDTSVAVPLVLRDHDAHRAVSLWARGHTVALAGHAALETFSVLTRLPAPSRVGPGDAALLLTSRFAHSLELPPDIDPIAELGRRGIAGGAVYDAVIALAALAHGVPLATRDMRAHATYSAVGVRTLVVT